MAWNKMHPKYAFEGTHVKFSPTSSFDQNSHPQLGVFVASFDISISQQKVFHDSESTQLVWPFIFSITKTPSEHSM